VKPRHPLDRAAVLGLELQDLLVQLARSLRVPQMFTANVGNPAHWVDDLPVVRRPVPPELDDRLETMFARADAEDTTVLAAAEAYAEQRLAEASGDRDWTAATMPC